MVRQLLHLFFFILPSRTGLPNKLTLYLKELELSAVKLATASSSSGGSSRLY